MITTAPNQNINNNNNNNDDDNKSLKNQLKDLNIYLDHINSKLEKLTTNMERLKELESEHFVYKQGKEKTLNDINEILKKLENNK